MRRGRGWELQAPGRLPAKGMPKGPCRAFQLRVRWTGRTAMRDSESYALLETFIRRRRRMTSPASAPRPRPLHRHPYPLPMPAPQWRCHQSARPQPLQDCQRVSSAHFLTRSAKIPTDRRGSTWVGETFCCLVGAIGSRTQGPAKPLGDVVRFRPE